MRSLFPLLLIVFPELFPSDTAKAELKVKVQLQQPSTQQSQQPSPRMHLVMLLIQLVLMGLAGVGLVAAAPIARRQQDVPFFPLLSNDTNVEAEKPQPAPCFPVPSNVEPEAPQPVPFFPLLDTPPNVEPEQPQPVPFFPLPSKVEPEEPQSVPFFPLLNDSAPTEANKTVPFFSLPSAPPPEPKEPEAVPFFPLLNVGIHHPWFPSDTAFHKHHEGESKSPFPTSPRGISTYLSGNEGSEMEGNDNTPVIEERHIPVLPPQIGGSIDPKVMEAYRRPLQNHHYDGAAPPMDGDFEYYQDAEDRRRMGPNDNDSVLRTLSPTGIINHMIEEAYPLQNHGIWMRSTDGEFDQEAQQTRSILWGKKGPFDNEPNDDNYAVRETHHRVKRLEFPKVTGPCQRLGDLTCNGILRKPSPVFPDKKLASLAVPRSNENDNGNRDFVSETQYSRITRPNPTEVMQYYRGHLLGAPLRPATDFQEPSTMIEFNDNDNNDVQAETLQARHIPYFPNGRGPHMDNQLHNHADNPALTTRWIPVPPSDDDEYTTLIIDEPHTNVNSNDKIVKVPIHHGPIRRSAKSVAAATVFDSQANTKAKFVSTAWPQLPEHLMEADSPGNAHGVTVKYIPDHAVAIKSERRKVGGPGNFPFPHECIDGVLHRRPVWGGADVVVGDAPCELVM